MDVSRRRAGLKTSVVAGSVWETRMKLDEVKGGIKVFNGDANPDDNADISRKFVKKTQIGVSGKRKTWKPESFDGSIQIAKGKTDSSSSSSSIKNCEQQSRELSVSADGIKRSSIPARKGRRSDDGNEKKPIQMRKQRSDVKEVVESGVQLRKVKSDLVNAANQSGKDIAIDNGIERNSAQLKKEKSEPPKVSDESVIQESGIEKNPPGIEEHGSEESCKEFVVCQEKVISTTHNQEDVAIEEEEEEEEEDDDDEEEEEEEEESGGEDEIEIEVEIEKKSLDIVEIKLPEVKKPLKKVETKSADHKKPEKKVEIEEKKVYQLRNRIAPTSSPLNKQPPPAMRRAEMYENLAKVTKPTSFPIENEYQNFPERHNKLQNLVDLVMWRDISRSAFAFGIGTFIIISSSYTKDLSVSFISVISYLGLVYLAAIFLYRSLICRGVIDIDDTSYVLGEEEAIWLLKLFLPYLNECLLKIKALFSGDPATTMKLAVLLFVFARCGSSITIWKMAKLGFFGVFTVPIVCSSYSTQLTAYAKFWIRRFRDAWDSCTHKKAVALAIFTLVWNLSSTVARAWAVFMMFVAVRYYQQSMELDDWVEEEDNAVAADDQTGPDRQGLGAGPTPPVEINKLKKKS